MSGEKAVLLLGRRDEPTDGVVDYCELLREAGARHGLSFELARVAWAERGWSEALVELRKEAAAWRDVWVFLQFTTLAWSRRGFPLRAPGVLRILRESGARPAVVFHDFFPLTGKGFVGKARELVQARALRQLYALSDLSLFTVAVNNVSWLPLRRDKAVFIPVGSNFPVLKCVPGSERTPVSNVPTIAVFGITGGPRGDVEVEEMVHAIKSVSSNGTSLRVVAIGRGCEVFEEKLRRALAGSPVELSVPGLLPAAELARELSQATLQLSVRGHVSSRRGSVIAGIVSGLPIVGYRGDETGFPMTEAGILLVRQGDREGLAHALRSVLTDQSLREELRQRSKAAAAKFFSWDAIAAQFAAAIQIER